MLEVGRLLLGGQGEVLDHGNVLLALHPPLQALGDDALRVLHRPRALELPREGRLGHVRVDHGDVLVQGRQQLVRVSFVGREAPVDHTAPHGDDRGTQAGAGEPGSLDRSQDRVGLQRHAAALREAEPAQNDGAPLLRHLVVASGESKRGGLGVEQPLPALLRGRLVSSQCLVEPVAAELEVAGSSVVINDELVGALLSVLRSGEELETVRVLRRVLSRRACSL